MLTSEELFRQILAISPVCLNEFAMGMGYGWIAPTLKLLQNSDHVLSLTTDQCSWTASLHDFGRILGPILSILLLDVVGRKKILSVCTVIFFLIWLLIVFTKSVAVVYAVRLLYGFAIGLNDATATIYLGENSKPNLRGLFAGVSIAFFYAGVWVEFVIASYLSYEMAGITNATITFFLLPCTYFYVEPAQFLVLKGRYEEAEKNFNWLRGVGVGQTDVVEFEKLKRAVSDESRKKLTFFEFVGNPSSYESVYRVLILSTLVMVTGASAISSFVSFTFSESSTLTANDFTILFGLLQFVSVCVSSCVIEKVNRRTMLLVSLLLIALAHGCTATLYYVHENVAHINQLPWLCFATITLYSMNFVGGVLPVLFAIRGELFPQNAKTLGGALAVIGNSLMGFVMTKVFLFVVERFGMYVNFAFYSCASLLTIWFVYFAIPETRGKTLSEIQKAVKADIKA